MNVEIQENVQSPSSTNLYLPGYYVTPPIFVGRKSLLLQIKGAINQRESSTLMGDHLIGKSSLLVTLERQLEGYPCQRLSCLAKEGTSLKAFIQTITDREADDDPDEAADVLSAWATEQKTPPVLLVDDFDVIYYRFPFRFFERLRAIVSDREVTLLLACSQELGILTERSSPFPNILRRRQLALLEAEAAEVLIQRGNNLFRADDAELMRTWAGRHPYFLQLLGHTLIEARMHGTSTESAIAHFQAEAALYFQELWKTLEEREQRALRESLTTPYQRLSLRVRGIVTTEGKPFAKVLTAWLEGL